jgi:DNA polymerase-3 subunit gamma/tau
MLLPAAADGDGAMLHRLERLERRLTIAPPEAAETPPPAGAADPAPIQPARRPAPPNRPARPTPPPAAEPPAAQPPPASSPPAQPPAVQPPEPEALAAPEQLDAAAVRRVWQALLDAVREESRTTQVLLSNATASAVEGSTLVLTLPNAPLARRLGDDRNTELIRAALRAVLGVEWQVRCEQASGDAGVTAGPQQPQHTRTRSTPPQWERPSTRPRPPADGPTHPEPTDPDPPDDDEEMQTEAAGVSTDPAARPDPEEAALALLADQLGARRIGGPS